MKFINGEMLKDMILSGANNLQNNKALIDKLNVFPVPDGDTGTNMSLTISYAIKELSNIEDVNDITSIGKAISKGSLMGARGNSGVILSQIIRGFAKAIEGKESLTTKDLAQAFKLGADTAYKAVIKPIEGTILTVVRESAEYALKICENETDIIKFLELVIIQANKSLDKTPTLLPTLKEAGVVDSGGKGLVLLYEGMLECAKGNIIMPMEASNVDNLSTTSSSSVNLDDIKFAYCTEFILETSTITDTEIRDLIIEYGDSLAVVGDEGIIKVHIHTNEPGTVLQHALNYGQLVTVKIENMRLQHENLILDSQQEQKEVKEKEFAFISTSMGDGLAKIFKDFGVDHIIEGGQTMNPSTSDFLEAIDKLNAKNIYILPNNSNIILSATQASELSDKNVIVLPTKTIPQGIICLLNFNPDASLDENTESMTEAIPMVNSGQITYAVRDTSMNGIDIKEGNYIGIANSSMSCAGEDKLEVLQDTLKALVLDDSSIITLYYGEDTTEDEAESACELIQETYPDLDVEVYYGGQPLYYYLISVE